MTRTFTYFAIGDTGFCAQSSLLFLAWVLLFKHRRLQLGALGIPRRQVPRILKALVRSRLSTPDRAANTLRLPVFGHISLRVHRGYKLFNLRDRSATKIFDADVDAAEAGRELQAARQAGGLDFAPTVLAGGPQDRWYRETFIPGTRGSKTQRSDPWPTFQNSAVGQLKALIESSPLQTIALGDCLADLHRRLTLQLADSRLDSDLHRATADFVQHNLAALEPPGDIQLQFALTHGDYSFVNFIYAGKRVYVIDWEGAGQRSLLHDLYNYFFTELYYRRTGEPLAGMIDAAIDLLLGQLDTRRLLPATSDLRTLYRRMYYLERLEMLLCRDPGETRTRVLRRTLEVFCEHDRAGGNQQQT